MKGQYFVWCLKLSSCSVWLALVKVWFLLAEHSQEDFQVNSQDINIFPWKQIPEDGGTKK